MKKICFIVWMFSISMVAQQKEIPLIEFQSLKIFDRINVELVPSDTNKLIIEGEQIEDVEVVQKDKELKIRMRFGKILQGEGIVAVLYYQKINEIEVNEGANLSSNKVVKSSNLKISNKEGSEVILQIDTDRLVARVGSGATLTLKGTAKFNEIVVNAGAIFEGKQLETEQTNVTCNAGGEAIVFVTKLLEAKTRLGGSIEVFGNPKSIKEDTSLGGDITIKN